MTIRNSVLGVALAGLAPFAPTAVVGQTTSEDTSTLQERAEARGFKAESVYEVSEIDTINLFNGNLAINIPIGQEYSANGNLSYGLVLSYNSSIWDLREEMYPNEPECGPKGRCTPPHWMRAIPNPLSNAGLGWTLSLGSLFAPNQFTSGTSVKNLAIEVPLVNGAKGGTVVSDPEGIYCGALGAACTHGFLEGSTVSLATIEEPGWYFDRWEDGCFGGQEVMTGSRTCKAFFTQTPPGAARLDVYVNEGIYEGSGNGTVTSSPGSINCRKEDPQPCSETFTVGDTIQLTASPDGDSEFAYWSKGCGTTTPTTYVYMNGPARTCWAKFDLKTPTGTFDLDVTPGIGDVTVTASSLPNGVQVCSKAQTNGCIYEIDALDDVALAVDNITDPQCWEHSGWLQAQCDNFQMTSNKFCTARYKFICGGGGGGGGVAPGFLEGEPVNETGQWMYASPDGAKHLFYEFMQPSEDDNDETVFYSRDNTYLRLKTAGVTKILEFPDGAQHHFADKGAGIEYELTKIEDAHGNTLDISYSFDSSGNYIWDLQDSVGRTHKVTFEYTSLGYQVDTVDLAAFGGQRGVYDFVYVQTSIDRDCRDNDPATSKQILVPLLTTVILPEGGSYKFGDSANPGYVTECSGGIVPPEPTPPPPGFWQINMMPGSNVGSGGRITASFGALDCTIDENQQVSGTCSDDIPSGQALSLTIQLLGEANTMQWVSPSHEYCDDPSILGSDGETIDCTPAFFCAGTGCVGIPGPPPPPPVLPEPNQDGTPGNLLEAALPTRGTIEWDYGAYWLPQKGGPYIQGLVGVAERRHYDRGGTFLGKWTYNNEVDKQPEYTNDPSTWPTATWTDVVNPTGDCTRHYFSAHPRSTAWDWAYGLPFYHDDPEAEGRYYSTRVYAGNSGTVCDDGPGPIRSTAVEYAKDGEVEPPLTFGYNDHDAARYNRNRRLKESVTIFHDDGNRWIKTVNSDFDSLGHYRRSKTTGSLKSGDSRVSYTNYSLNATPMPIEKWLLTRFEYQSTTEGGNTARTDVQFNSDGFLECRRVRKNSGGRSTSDVLVVFTADNDGNVTQEDWYGGDVGSVGTASVCGSKGMRSYGIDHSYQYGSLKTSEYDNAPGNFFSYDATIDFNTGLASSTRDTAGIQTNFDYDLEGRLLEVQPALSACTTYTYTSATSSNPANVVVRKKPNSCNGTALLTEEFYFDGFGRVEKERREWPGTNLQDRVTKYNARGWKLSVTEWGSNSKTSFNGYDPFGRAGQIVAPDGSNVDFSYFGNRAIVRDSSVETSSGSTTVTTTEEYDSFGRLSKVTEGNGVTTQYEYDVGNRLSNVLINGAQERDFTYDNRGFLQNEKHPEKGAHGNGFVAYSNYDPKGYAGRKDDNGTTLTFTYDGAERLTKVEDDSSPPRLFKSFTYGSSASTTSLGKLEKTRRNNFIVPPGNTAETNFWVEEIYTYDAEGRVSELETTCSPYQMHQSFTYDELGGIADLEYPICDVTCASAPNQARTLTYEYQKGRVTKVRIRTWVSVSGCRMSPSTRTGS